MCLPLFYYCNVAGGYLFFCLLSRLDYLYLQLLIKLTDVILISKTKYIFFVANVFGICYNE